MELLGLKRYTIEPGIVRGLDYYTGLVFEVECKDLGAQKQICGGGEYSLIPLFGGRETATAGFALGFDRLQEALIQEGRSYSINGTDIFLIPVSQNEIGFVAAMTSELRNMGLKADMELRGRNISKALKYANAIGTKFACIIGENEVNEGKVTVKDMRSGEQIAMGSAQLGSYLLEQE